MKRLLFVFLLLGSAAWADGRTEYGPMGSEAYFEMQNISGGASVSGGARIDTVFDPNPPTTVFSCDFEDGTLCGFTCDKSGNGTCTNVAAEGVGGSRAIRLQCSTCSSARLNRTISGSLKNPPLTNPYYIVEYSVKMDSTTVACCTSAGQVKVIGNRFLNCTGCVAYALYGFGKEFPGSCSTVGNTHCFIRDQGTVHLYTGSTIAADTYYKIKFCMKRNGSPTNTGEVHMYIDDVQVANETHADEGDNTTSSALRVAGGIFFRQNWSGTATIYVDNISVKVDSGSCPA